ncbi:MAG: hypothetical protein MRY79_09610 [Alphaproteobacteria bacterium]|nr:hypothetical protein [Alphaproteobacteria bacterium]
MTKTLEDIGQNVNADMKAWVVFSGQSDIAWLKILRSGFRHCFVLLHDGTCWSSIDPLSSYTDIQIHYHVTPDFDLPAWLEGRGHRVLSMPIKRDHKKPAPLAFMTCVESVKRILGIHKRFIFTPYQLYRFLKQQEQTQKQKQESNQKKLKGELSWVA